MRGLEAITEKIVTLRDEMTRSVSQKDYGQVAIQNREIFLSKHGQDFAQFEKLLQTLQAIWLRVARERDRNGKSHVGLSLLSSILIRHCVFGFQQLITFQSFLAWLCFRPGLESLLIIGKWVDDPASARIWMNRNKNERAYRKVFSGKNLASASLPEAKRLRNVLTQLNDQFVHPNPYFAYRETDLRPLNSQTAQLVTRFFDDRGELYEAHLLAYLHLLETIVIGSDRLLVAIFENPTSTSVSAEGLFVEQNRGRAKSLADSDPVAKKIMEDLGLWNFSDASR
jgi:hypothetical protein